MPSLNYFTKPSSSIDNRIADLLNPQSAVPQAASLMLWTNEITKVLSCIGTICLKKALLDCSLKSSQSFDGPVDCTLVCGTVQMLKNLAFQLSAIRNQILNGVFNCFDIL